MYIVINHVINYNTHLFASNKIIGKKDNESLQQQSFGLLFTSYLLQRLLYKEPGILLKPRPIPKKKHTNKYHRP